MAEATGSRENGKTFMDSRILPGKVWQYLKKDQKELFLNFGFSNQMDYSRVAQEEFGEGL